jgi:hypothetical protein
VQNKSSGNLKHGMPDQTRNKTKFQSAFAKVLRVQRFTSQRRHTILSMAPIDIGTKSQLPTAIICDQSISHPLKQNNITINNHSLISHRNVNEKQTSSDNFKRKEQSRN